MHTPDHWYPSEAGASLGGRLLALALAPAGALYDLAGRIRFALAKPFAPSVPIICIGNATAGGTGKTPLVMAVAHGLKALGHTPHILTRGYRGRLAGPVRVVPAKHGSEDVGDEPLLLAEVAPTFVAKSRSAGVAAATRAGADIILMDDGLQNPSVKKTISILVVDGEVGFGNGRILPAGPLRERLARCLARTDAVMLMGETSKRTEAQLAAWSGPTFHAHLEPVATDLHASAYLAFAGIARPEKFFATLDRLGVKLIERIAFPDHHAFSAAEIDALIARASRAGATPITTAKDAARLSAQQRTRIAVLPVAAQIASGESFGRFLIDRLASAGAMSNKPSLATFSAD